MARYHNNPIYQKTGRVISSVIVWLQAISIADTLHLWKGVNPLYLFTLFIFAYIIADFINGIVHLYMDNNTRYNGLFGPFVASFHLHHLNPQYTKKNPVLVYFYESGSKFWLMFYLFALICIQHKCHISFEMQFLFTWIGLLSSFAEVSHYWCHHMPHPSNIIRFLQNNGVLLSKKHHMVHHLSDNKNYAFLNGVSDKLINFIACRVYSGYKNNADAHTKLYKDSQTNNRRPSITKPPRLI